MNTPNAWSGFQEQSVCSPMDKWAGITPVSEAETRCLAVFRFMSTSVAAANSLGKHCYREKAGFLNTLL